MKHKSTITLRHRRGEAVLISIECADPAITAAVSKSIRARFYDAHDARVAGVHDEYKRTIIGYIYGLLRRGKYARTEF